MKWTSKFGADLGPPSQSLYFTRDDWIFFYLQVLQDQGCPPSHLEVRVQHRICPRLIKEADDVRALVMRIKVDNLTGAVRSVPVSGSVLAAAQCVYLCDLRGVRPSVVE